jgi:kynurenine formamidase
MCPPNVLQALYGPSGRRGIVAKGLAATAALACATHAPVAARAAAATASQPRSFKDVADLTQPLYEGFPTYGGDKWFTKESFLTFGKDQLNINKWVLMEHTGTHMDAPLHFSADGHSIDQIPVTDLVVPLALIDISARAQDNPDTALTPDDVRAWEAANGPLPEGCCVVMNSGWHRLLASPKFTGVDSKGSPHTPGFHGETAHMLLERNVKGLGVDTLSLDTGQQTHVGAFAVHTSWLPAGRWGVEALANLDSLPAKGATLVLGAPKVTGGTGGPTRVFALI